MLCLLDNSWLWYLYTYSTSNGPQNLAFGHLLEIPIPIYTVNHIHKYYTVHITWYKNSRITWYLQVYRCTCRIFFVLLYVNMSWIHWLSPPSICIPHSAFCYCLCLPVPVCDVSLWWCVGTHSTAGKWNVTSISCYVSASLWRTLSSGSCRRRDNGTVAL